MKKTMKVIQKIYDLTVSSGNGGAKQVTLPSQLDLSNIKNSADSISFNYKDITCTYSHLRAIDHLGFQFVSSKKLSENELQSMCNELEMGYEERFNSLIAKVENSPEPLSIPIIQFHKCQDLILVEVYVLGGSSEYASDLPYLHRLAVVELSEDFKEKIGL